MPDVNALGERIVGTVRSFVARSIAPIEERLGLLERAFAERPAPERGEQGEPGARGETGGIGPAGPVGPPGPVGLAGADGRDGANGINGKDGAAGADGKSVSVADIETVLHKMLELRFAEYVLEHERRLPEIMQRMIDALEKPKDGRDGRDGKDGKDGEDGADGFDLRHFDVTQTDERTIVLRFKDLRREVVRPLSFPIPIPRAIWKADEMYRKGDIVTWGGSAFIKQTDEDGGKPEDGTHWRLFVKRGRDGKDGEKGEKGEPGKIGRAGRDLTQLGQNGAKW